MLDEIVRPVWIERMLTDILDVIEYKASLLAFKPHGIFEAKRDACIAFFSASPEGLQSNIIQRNPRRRQHVLLQNPLLLGKGVRIATTHLKEQTRQTSLILSPDERSHLITQNGLPRQLYMCKCGAACLREGLERNICAFSSPPNADGVSHISRRCRVGVYGRRPTYKSVYVGMERWVETLNESEN